METDKAQSDDPAGHYGDLRKLNSQFFLKHKKKQKKSQIRHCQIDEVGVIIIQLRECAAMLPDE